MTAKEGGIVAGVIRAGFYSKRGRWAQLEWSILGRVDGEMRRDESAKGPVMEGLEAWKKYSASMHRKTGSL